MRRIAWGTMLACAAAASIGCGPRLVQDYTVRQNELFFVVQKGARYELGTCKRAPDGQLAECTIHDVEFR